MRDDGRAITEQAVELAADEIGHSGCGTAIRNAQEIDAGGRLEQLEPEMGNRAETGDRDRDLTRHTAGPGSASPRAKSTGNAAFTTSMVE